MAKDKAATAPAEVAKIEAKETEQQAAKIVTADKPGNERPQTQVPTDAETIAALNARIEALEAEKAQESKSASGEIAKLKKAFEATNEKNAASQKDLDEARAVAIQLDRNLKEVQAKAVANTQTVKAVEPAEDLPSWVCHIPKDPTAPRHTVKAQTAGDAERVYKDECGIIASENPIHVAKVNAAQ